MVEPLPGRCIVELARIGLGVVDQVLDRLDLGELLLHHQDVRQARNLRDRDEVLLRIEGELGVEVLVDRDLRRHHEQGRAVGRALGDAVHADVGGRARDVLDDDARVPQRREAIGDDAADDVGGAAGRVGDDQLDGADAGRVRALRDGGARQDRKRGSGQSLRNGASR